MPAVAGDTVVGLAGKTVVVGLAAVAEYRWGTPVALEMLFG